VVELAKLADGHGAKRRSGMNYVYEYPVARLKVSGVHSFPEHRLGLLINPRNSSVHLHNINITSSSYITSRTDRVIGVDTTTPLTRSLVRGEYLEHHHTAT